MAYPDDGTVQTWLDALHGLNIRLKKMFGCYCVYCDGVAVGWLSGEVSSIEELEQPRLPYEGKEPEKGREDLPSLHWNNIILPSEIGAI